MKKTFPILLLLLGLFSQLSFAQSTPGIVSTRTAGINDLSSELFRVREKNRLRIKNDELRDANYRLERQIVDLEQRLDNCQDGQRVRYPRRRDMSPFNLRQDLLGERRRLEEEHQRLLRENAYLQGQRDWLGKELNECQAQRSYRSRDYDYRQPRSRDYRDYDDRYQRDRTYRNDDHCTCHSCSPKHKGHAPSHSKGKGKKKGHHKHHRYDD